MQDRRLTEVDVFYQQVVNAIHYGTAEPGQEARVNAIRGVAQAKVNARRQNLARIDRFARRNPAPLDQLLYVLGRKDACAIAARADLRVLEEQGMLVLGSRTQGSEANTAFASDSVAQRFGEA